MANSSPASALPRVTGADLPEEVLHAILQCFELQGEDECAEDEIARSAKHVLVSLSFVNRYWSAVIRSLLFRTVMIGSLDDMYFLESIICRHALPDSPLEKAITQVQFYQPLPPLQNCKWHSAASRMLSEKVVPHVAREETHISKTAK